MPTNGNGIQDAIRLQQEKHDQAVQQWYDTGYGQWGLSFVDPNSEHYASNLQAALTRQEWEDWKKNSLPVFMELKNSIGNKDLQSQEVGRSTDITNSAYDAIRGNQSRRNASYGMAIDPTVATANESALNRNQAMSVAAARNSTRSNIRDREMALMAGGMSSLAQEQQ